MVDNAAEASCEDVHVLVVDDSAVMRQFMWSLVSRQDDMTIDTAADASIARSKMELRRPDVIVLDLEMPGIDGLTFLRRLMSEDPIPVVVCSSFADTERGIKALELGAMEVLGKPRVGVEEYLRNSEPSLLDTIRAAAQAHDRSWLKLLPAPPRLTADVVLPRAPPPRAGQVADTLVVVGASTGGSQTLRQVLEVLPRDVPGIVVVQHMPEDFTATFARHLDETCVLRVREAKNGDRVERGRVLIAPGNKHTFLVRRPGGPAVEVVDGPLVSRHRPSIDVLFRSAAQVGGGRAIGILMTGMGEDGVEGLAEMQQAGAETIAQDKASSAVYGMPKRAIERGIVDHVGAPLEIAELIRQLST